MQGKRTDYCKVKIEVLNLFLGEKLCIKLVKPVSITRGVLPLFNIPNVMRRLLTFTMGNTDTNNNFFRNVKYNLLMEII